ncbi:H-NS histone family protein [Variovorax sp. J31P207]|uniref:H-NS histone family protein n=1 Tax=Variovorax sp. J31P207 TaxID=3053510 RepID=UPI002575A57B|nr:H-NS histone family protein [Variovorax sp. J31P207]MDM0065344.1 H-NS histone family protein [Variovorax sp. J31P207]
MATTYRTIQKQIDKLQKQAESLRDREVSGVVERIKVAIAHYGLTAADLGLEPRGGAKKSTPTKKAPGKAKSAFGDSTGNVWSGRGPHPHWLRDALAAGHSLEEFRLGTGSGPEPILQRRG